MSSVDEQCAGRDTRGAGVGVGAREDRGARADWTKAPAPLITPPSVFVRPAPSAPATVPLDTVIALAKVEPLAWSKASVPPETLTPIELLIDPLTPLPTINVPPCTLVGP